MASYKTEKYKSKMKKNIWEFLVWLLLIAAISLFCFGCKKEVSTASSGSTKAQTTSSTLEIKLEGWYNNDSLLFSPSAPCGSIKQCYVKDSVKWFSYTGPKTGNISTLTIQQTTSNFTAQDSISITIYVNGSMINKASGKKLLITSYTY